jgi:hypothetical protein
MSRSRLTHRYLYIGMLTLGLMPGLAAAAPPAVVADGPVKVSVSVDRNAAQVAEPIRLTLDVEAPRGTRIELPLLADKLGEFDVLNSEQTKDIPAATGESRRWTVDATLETIRTGTLAIPPLEVHYTTADNSSTFKTLSTTPIEIRIKSVLENRADPTKFRDIKDTLDLAVPEVRSTKWLAYTAAGIGGGVVVALAVLAVVKRRRGPSPAEWALASIADLEKLPITNSADAEAAYNELVDVLREFFELEFNVPTLSRTTREFLAQAASVVGLDKTARERLASLSSIADEIKFARLGVGEPQVRQAIEQAKAFVDECEAHRRALEKEAA